MVKAAVTTLFLGLSISLSAVAQSSGEGKALKGPAYKNASPSEKYSGSDALLVKKESKQLKGPQAKNQKPWQTDKSDYQLVRFDEMTGKNSKGLKGPAYKNYKPKANN